MSEEAVVIHDIARFIPHISSSASFGLVSTMRPAKEVDVPWLIRTLGCILPYLLLDPYFYSNLM